MINVGILGTGRIGKIHIRNLYNHARINIKGVVDPFVDKEFTESLGLKIYSDVDSILADKDIDAIFICTSSDTHYDLIKSSLSANKAIFCEKPVDLDIHRILEIKNLLDKSGGYLQVGFNRRFDSNFKRLSKIVHDGAVGDLLQLRITSRDFTPPPRSYVEGSGGMFLDMSIHDFDMLRYVSHSEVKEVYVIGKSRVTDYADIDIDTANIMCLLENDCIATIENCRQAPYGYDQRLEVFGSKGRAFCENKYDNSVTICDSSAQSRQNPLDFFLERYAASYNAELEDFIQSILANGRPSVGINESIEASLIAIAAMESMKTNRPVSLSDIRKQYNIA